MRMVDGTPGQLSEMIILYGVREVHYWVGFNVFSHEERGEL